MRKLLLLLPFMSVYALAQTGVPYNELDITPNATQTAVGTVNFYDKAQDFYTALAGADSITANITFRLPAADGAPGSCLVTDGSGNTSFTGGCSPAVYCAASGTNTLTCPGIPPPVSYNVGMSVLLLAANNNTTGVTLSINSLATVNIYAGGVALTSGALTAGSLYTLTYDGTEFNMQTASVVLTPPIVLSATLSGAVLTVTNLGTGPAITITNGGLNLGGASGGTISSNGSSAVNFTANGTNANFNLRLQPNGTGTVSGTTLFNTDSFTNSGIFFFRLNGVSAELETSINGSGAEPTSLLIGQSSSTAALTNINLQFAASTLFTFTSGGRLGVNTSAPAATLDINGVTNFRGGASVQADNTYNFFSPSLAPATIFSHVLEADSAQVTGLLTQNYSGATWYINSAGYTYLQDVTAHYIFDSIGDVAQTGTGSTSGTTLTASGGAAFDESWQGGQILICPTSCTGANGALYNISAYVSATQLTLTTSPGTLSSAGWSYAANAFQTSTGTMYVSGTGAGFFQDLVARYVINSQGDVPVTGTVNISGANNLVWVAGNVFDFSMVGGSIEICPGVPNCTGTSGLYYTARQFFTPQQMSIYGSPGPLTGAGYRYQANAFQTSTGTMHITGSGFGYFQDLATRYVFDSIGDVPATGSATASSTNLSTSTGVFDLSWLGGQILLCTSTCTASNGTFYLVTAFNNAYSLTLACGGGGQPACLSGTVYYSYQANAFQTSTGTMYITGTGFGYFQNLVVTDGFTSYGAGGVTGTITCSGTACTWISGATYNLSMQGGIVAIGGSEYVISAVPTTTTLTLSTSCSGTCTAASLSYTANAFQISTHSAWIDSFGGSQFTSVVSDYSPTGDNYITIGGHGGPSASATLYMNANAGLNCWMETANGTGSSLVLKYDANCTGVYSPSTEVTYTPTGVTFAQPITVPSCSGCSSGVTSFNTRTGAVTLAATDVGAVGAQGGFEVFGAGDVVLTVDPGGPAGAAELALMGNSGGNCWFLNALGTGSTLRLQYDSSCAGTFSPTNEIAFTPTGVSFAQSITVPSCSGCSSGVTSVTASSPLSSSGGTTPNISCSTCITSAVTSVAAGTGITVSGSSSVTVTLNQTPGSGTAFLNYGGGGLQVWSSDLTGATGSLSTYTNLIPVYNSAGTFVGYIPII